MASNDRHIHKQRYTNWIPKKKKKKKKNIGSLSLQLPSFYGKNGSN